MKWFRNMLITVRSQHTWEKCNVLQRMQRIVSLTIEEDRKVPRLVCYVTQENFSSSLQFSSTVKFCLFSGTMLVKGNAVLEKANPYGCASVTSTPCWFIPLCAMGEVFRAVHHPKSWGSPDTTQMGINIHLMSIHSKVRPFIDLWRASKPLNTKQFKEAGTKGEAGVGETPRHVMPTRPRRSPALTLPQHRARWRCFVSLHRPPWDPKGDL